MRVMGRALPRRGLGPKALPWKADLSKEHAENADKDRPVVKRLYVAHPTSIPSSNKDVGGVVEEVTSSLRKVTTIANEGNCGKEDNEVSNLVSVERGNVMAGAIIETSKTTTKEQVQGVESTICMASKANKMSSNAMYGKVSVVQTHKWKRSAHKITAGEGIESLAGSKRTCDMEIDEPSHGSNDDKKQKLFTS